MKVKFETKPKIVQNNKTETIEFVENLNHEECMKLLNKLDFSNYALIYQIKE